MNELLSNTKETILLKNGILTNAAKILPVNWIGTQAYAANIVNTNEKLILVPFAEASQTEGDMRVWLPVTIKK